MIRLRSRFRFCFGFSWTTTTIWVNPEKRVDSVNTRVNSSQQQVNTNDSRTR
ncbi:hypothetical protein Hanom_Chr15g01406351 [Helianthus anomalus]